MKYFIFSLATVIFTLFAPGCAHKHDHSHTGGPEHKLEVQLDNGERWLANPETTEGIHNMLNLVESFSTNDDQAAYATLRKKLEAEFQFIFSNCTMKGMAHDQLHNYLLPMKEMFSGLSVSDTENQKAQVRKIKEHLDRYKTYFYS